VASVLCETQLLVGALAADRRREATTSEQLFDGSLLKAVPVSRAIGRSAARLRAQLGLKLVDAVVAATAVSEGCTALVANDSDFRRLETLAYIHLDDFT